MRTTATLLLLLAPALAPAASTVPAQPATSERAILGVHAGTTGPLAMQHDSLDLGLSFDPLAVRLAPEWIASTGLRWSTRPHRTAWQLYAGAKRRWTVERGRLRLVPFVFAGAAANAGSSRGSRDLALAARGAAGSALVVSPRVALLAEVSVEVGPLVSPGVALQGAVRGAFGVELLL